MSTHDVTMPKGNESGSDIAVEHFIAYDIVIGAFDVRMREVRFAEVKNAYKSRPDA